MLDIRSALILGLVALGARSDSPKEAMFAGTGGAAGSGSGGVSGAGAGGASSGGSGAGAGGASSGGASGAPTGSGGATAVMDAIEVPIG